MQKSLDYLDQYVPSESSGYADNQRGIPSLAKESSLLREIEDAIRLIPTNHRLLNVDSRNTQLEPHSVHLIVTSPPYWTLKKYRESSGQLGDIQDYEEFLIELDKVWELCYNALVPGGRVICVVGDVCLSRRKNNGQHTVVPLHASIQEHCRRIGYNNLAPIIWYKIANASYEVKNGSGFLGKPYEPNGVIKNDIEYILMERKPGGYRRPTNAMRILSVISEDNHKKWFKQIWSEIAGASTRDHPAPFPLSLAERLIRMFSFVGDTVLDPFLGTGTTSTAALLWGRNSIGLEIDSHYYQQAVERIQNDIYKYSMFNQAVVETE